MNENVKIVFGLLGGLALFLYGMNGMSDALQKTAGDKMKKILSFLTKNPIMGALAGALVTAVLQSSSATTVMVIGFVSAGLMSLPQASWGIMANDAHSLIQSQPIQIIWPVLAICLTMLSLNFIGDGLSEALDPKKK